MPTFTFWYSANGTCLVILTRRIFFLNNSNYYTFEKSKTPNKIITIVQQNKWKRNIWHTSNFTKELIKPRMQERAKWFANRSRMVCEPSAHMCGLDCKPALCCPQTIRMLFATNQNLWFFAQTQIELHAPGVLSMHRVSFARLRFAKN